jgi:hypothetical protein
MRRAAAAVAKPCTLRYPVVQAGLAPSKKEKTCADANPIMAARRAAVFLKDTGVRSVGA